jgi:alkanesulfonate monooxygenase SsuD/methylene tetrahydromethanopterin reductase-like flavin-dependent oxidoreductase (luciferase family)
VVTMLPVRFAVQIPPFTGPNVIVGLAVDAEDAGWDGVFVWDHLQWDTHLGRAGLSYTASMFPAQGGVTKERRGPGARASFMSTAASAAGNDSATVMLSLCCIWQCNAAKALGPDPDPGGAPGVSPPL